MRPAFSNYGELSQSSVHLRESVSCEVLSSSDEDERTAIVFFGLVFLLFSPRWVIIGNILHSPCRYLKAYMLWFWPTRVLCGISETNGQRWEEILFRIYLPSSSFVEGRVWNVDQCDYLYRKKCRKKPVILAQEERSRFF